MPVPPQYEMSSVDGEKLRQVLRSIDREARSGCARPGYIRNCLVITLALQILTIGTLLAHLLR